VKQIKNFSVALSYESGALPIVFACNFSLKVPVKMQLVASFAKCCNSADENCKAQQTPVWRTRTASG
jgi:dihydrodipicolinate reductase